MSKKIKIQINKQKFELPSTALVFDKWNNENYIYMSAKNTASIIKQFVKKNFPNVKVWATSDVYSGGSSVRVNVSNSDGSAVSETIYKSIKSFSDSFKAGYFDGMTDCYEYSSEDIKTDNGTQLKYFPSYIFVDNKPKWDSVEYWMNEWNNFDPTNYSRPMVGKTLWEQFINFNSSYWKKVTLDSLTKVLVKA